MGYNWTRLSRQCLTASCDSVGPASLPLNSSSSSRPQPLHTYSSLKHLPTTWPTHSESRLAHDAAAPLPPDLSSCRSVALFGGIFIAFQAFGAHCYHKGTAMKHPVPDGVTSSFVNFGIWALWRSALSVRMPGCQKLQMTAQPGLAQDALYLCPYRNSGRERVNCSIKLIDFVCFPLQIACYCHIFRCILSDKAPRVDIYRL